MMIAVVDSVIIDQKEIESETQLKSENWQAISQQARIERSEIRVTFIRDQSRNKILTSNFTPQVQRGQNSKGHPSRKMNPCGSNGD